MARNPDTMYDPVSGAVVPVSGGVSLGPSLARTAGAATRAVVDVPGAIKKSVAGAWNNVAGEFSAGYNGTDVPPPATPSPSPATPSPSPATPSPPPVSEQPKSTAESSSSSPQKSPTDVRQEWRNKPTEAPNSGYVAPAGSGSGTYGGVTRQIDDTYGRNTNVFSSLPVLSGNEGVDRYPRSYAPDETRQRSQDLDAAFASALQKAQQPINSYGDLFQRRSALHALSALAGLAQSAGANTVAASGAQLQADVQSRQQDIARQGQLLQAEAEGRRDVTARRGQDLGFESTLAGQNVQREGNYLRDLFSQRQAELQAGTQLGVAGIQAETQRQNALAGAEAAQVGYAAKYPTAPLVAAYLRNRDLNGNPLTPATRAETEAKIRLLTKANPLDALLAQSLSEDR